jgi:hypothetical protein
MLAGRVRRGRIHSVHCVTAAQGAARPRSGTAELHAAIHGGVRIGAFDGPGFAVGDGLQACGVYAVALHQVVAHGVGARSRQLQVVGIAASGVGVAFDSDDPFGRQQLDAFGESVELGACGRNDLGGVEREADRQGKRRSV